MAEFEDMSTPEERIVAVFRDQATAERAADQARNRGAQNVTVGGHNDEVRALVGEMREETSEAWAGPSVAIYSAEMARHIPGPTVAAALIGAIVALPFGFIEWGSVTLIGRLVLAACSGAIGGGTIGFLLGGFLGARRRANLELAEERGVVVGMQGGKPEATAELVNAGAIRVDRMLGQQPIDTVTSGEEQTPAESVMDQPIPQSEP